MRKKWISLICACAMVLVLAGCGDSEAKKLNYTDGIFVGEITEIDGSFVTVEMGSVEENQEEKAFSGNGDILTLDFAGATVLNSEMEEVEAGDLAVGDVLQMTFDGDGSVTRAEAVSLTGNGDDSGTGGGAPDDSGTMGGGDMPGGTMGGDMPGGGNMGGDTPGGGTGGPGGNGGGGSGEVDQGTSATTLDSDGSYSGETYTSSGSDENALRIDGATVTLDGITVDKNGGASSNAENGDFYGMNAALLATNGAQVTITNSTVNSSVQGGNGVFSYGTGTTVTVSDTVITTTSDNSGGLQTTGGGTTYGNNLTVTTSGSSAAAIRSDRGGGTVVVDRGTYTSNGYNSPAIYCTADITVSNADLTANNSEALVIEGKNSITLNNCDVTGNMSSTKGTSSDENVHNVMIYQSMSGDADVGTANFSMTGGTLTGRNGDMFYITNTSCVVTLSGVETVNLDENGYFLRVSGNSGSRGWGSAGSNGGKVDFTAADMTFEGNILVDEISTMNLTLSDGTRFTGKINVEANAQGGSRVSDNAVVTVESGCTWTLTGDCSLTSLKNEGTINYNGHTITLADGTVLSN